MDKKIEKLAKELAKILANKKATDVICLDISQKTIIADAFIIASGRSSVQVKALCDEIDEYCKENEIVKGPMEGYQAGRWAIIDLKDIVVHIFHNDEREFYDLERLWSDADNRTEFK